MFARRIDALEKLNLYLAIKSAVRGERRSNNEKWSVSKAADLFNIFWKILEQVTVVILAEKLHSLVFFSLITVEPVR